MVMYSLSIALKNIRNASLNGQRQQPQAPLLDLFLLSTKPILCKHTKVNQFYSHTQQLPRIGSFKLLHRAYGLLGLTSLRWYAADSKLKSITVWMADFTHDTCWNAYKDMLKKLQTFYWRGTFIKCECLSFAFLTLDMECWSNKWKALWNELSPTKSLINEENHQQI